MTRKTNFVKPMLEALEDRIAPATYFWDPSGATTDIDEKGTVNGQQVYVNLDAGMFGGQKAQVLPQRLDTIIFTGQANADCTLDVPLEVNVQITKGYSSTLDIQTSGLTLDSLADDATAGNIFKVDCDKGNLIIASGQNNWRSFLLSGAGQVQFDDPYNNFWGEFSGLSCEDDCQTSLANGTLNVGPSSQTSGWSTVAMKNVLTLSQDGNAGGRLKFIATANGTSQTAIMSIQGALNAYITTDENAPNTIIWYSNPNGVAQPMTFVNISVKQNGGTFSAKGGGVWNTNNSLDGWSYTIHGGKFELGGGTTLAMLGGFIVSGPIGGPVTNLDITDTSNCAIITGMTQTEPFFLDIATSGALNFISPTGFGTLTYQNIEVNGGTVNMRIAGGLNTACDTLQPEGNGLGLTQSLANFQYGTLDVTADNAVVLGSGTTWTLVLPNPNSTIQEDFTTDFLPTGTGEDTATLPGSWTVETDAS